MSDEAYLPVTVYPKAVYQAHISRCEEAIEWEFTQDHPLLWQYEPACAITCNSPLSLEQWLRIVESARGKLAPGLTQAEWDEYIPWRNVYQWGKSGSFSLGDFPRPLFLAIRQALDERAIRYYAGKVPEPTRLPVLFLTDGGDYIIAEDFEVDIPEFVHRPEWFQPH